MSEYAERDYRGLDDHYIKHVSAMTEEGLHSKAAIAAELAHRDCQIDVLQAQCEVYRALLKQARDQIGITPKSMVGNKSLAIAIDEALQTKE